MSTASSRGLLAGAAMAIVLPVAAGDHIDIGLAPADIALVLAGSALGGAVSAWAVR